MPHSGHFLDRPNRGSEWEYHLWAGSYIETANRLRMARWRPPSLDTKLARLRALGVPEERLRETFPPEVQAYLDEQDVLSALVPLHFGHIIFPTSPRVFVEDKSDPYFEDPNPAFDHDFAARRLRACYVYLTLWGKVPAGSFHGAAKYLNHIGDRIPTDDAGLQRHHVYRAVESVNLDPASFYADHNCGLGEIETMLVQDVLTAAAIDEIRKRARTTEGLSDLKGAARAHAIAEKFDIAEVANRAMAAVVSGKCAPELMAPRILIDFYEWHQKYRRSAPGRRKRQAIARAAG